MNPLALCYGPRLPRTAENQLTHETKRYSLGIHTTSSCSLSNHGPPSVSVLVMKSTSCNYVLLVKVFLHTVLFQQ